MFRPVRTRLLEDLERVDSARPKVVSLVAPIGYGKTVLMSELHTHLCRSGEQCFWIGLDDRDSNLERFLSSLETVLSGRGTVVHMTQALMRGDTPLEGRIEALIARIASLDGATTLFIDNLNSCVDEALGDFLDALVFRTPAAVRFVWSSTTALAINLGRAKLEGKVRQVGFAELSLDAREAQELLGTELQGHLGTDGIEILLRQTEGWPAAVRMAQIVLADAEQPLVALETFSGSDEDIAALLNRQVLRGFTPALREFLLCLSQLHTFGIEMCRYVLGSEDAERHLDFLFQRNVFIIPLDRNRKRYRLHGLFRQYLLSEAERSLAAEKKHRVLQRAAEWYERNGEWQDAIDYALAAGEFAAASRMLDRTATYFVRDRGDIPQYIDWIERLRTEDVKIGWEAEFWYVWALIFHRRYELGRIQHERLAERLSHHAGSANPPPSDLAQRLGHIRICIDIFTDRLEEGYRDAERWLAEEKTNDPYNVGSVGGLKSICLASLFRFEQARQSMRLAEPILHQIGGAYTMAWMTLAYAAQAIYEGDYAQAHRDLSVGLPRACAALGEDAVVCDTLALLRAKCAVEMGFNEEAASMLRLGLRAGYGNGLVDTAACGFDAAVKLWNRSADDSVSIARLREIASSYPPRLSLMLSCYLIQRLLRLGRLKEALAEADRIGLNPEGGAVGRPSREEMAKPRYRELFMATAIELQMATHRFKQVEPLVAEEIRLAQADGRAARLVELRLTRAAIALQTGKAKAAAKDLSFAVSAAAQRCIVRPFRDQGETIAALVNDTKLSSWAFPQKEEREFFAQICKDLPIDDQVLQKRAVVRGADRGLPVSLTAREVELLSLIDIGLSNKQMTDHTDISLGTIKWHLKNLYKKLGVTNRSAALARARDLSFLN